MEYIRSPRDAELNAAVRMRKLGYPDAKATPIGPDHGLDVIAAGAVAQVKWETAATGRPAVQRFYGAAAAHPTAAMLFLSASGFTTGAVQFADSVDIALFTYSPLGDLTPENTTATTLLKKRSAKARRKKERAEKEKTRRERAAEVEARRKRKVARFGLLPSQWTEQQKLDARLEWEEKYGTKS